MDAVTEQQLREQFRRREHAFTRAQELLLGYEHDIEDHLVLADYLLTGQAALLAGLQGARRPDAALSSDAATWSLGDAAKSSPSLGTSLTNIARDAAGGRASIAPDLPSPEGTPS